MGWMDGCVCVCVCVCVLEMVDADGGGRIVTALAYDVALLSTSANPYVSARATHVTRMTATTMRPPVALVLVLYFFFQCSECY